MEGTVPYTKTTNKDRILNLYLDLNHVSAKLLNQSRTNAPGDIYFTFIEFRQLMFELYNSAHRYRNFNPELKSEFRVWMGLNMPNRPTPKQIRRSVELYNKAIDELVRIEVLEL